MSLSKNPAFNLKAVLQETNIAADTLRAWERRYGLPMPQRTAGGHRLYSQYDIETIKWLLARQAEGLSISRAVDAWNEKIASGTDPLAGAISSTFSAAQGASAIYIAPGTNLDSMRAQWVAACLKFHEANAEQVLNQAFSIFPIEAVCMEVLQKGMAEIGGLWYENNASVQQEHFASGLAMRRLDSLISASPAPTRKQTILIGCPAEEMHTFTPLLVALFLRRRGYNVIYLGANVPNERFEETVKAVHADLVVLAAQQLITAATLQQAASMLSTHNIPVAYGGRIFGLQPQLFRTITGFFLGAKIKEAIEQIEDLATSKIQIPESVSVAQEYKIAAAAFQTHRSNIEAAFNQSVPSLGHDSESMKIATEFLGDNIIAALNLGDMSLVDGELEWTKTMLNAKHISPHALHDYIKLYAEAVNATINGSGKPVSDWINIRANDG